jgi:glycosyltransferase involved in cell wall biosynthesis
MLSILILYNYNAYPLVKKLHSQCLEATIDFEIFCIDDASNEYESNNNQFNLYQIASILPKNIGRSSIRNLLASKSKKKWLLFLDCDTENNNFIANYVNQINSSAAKAFGGLIYSNTKPNNNQLLRWVFGNRESIPLSEKKSLYNNIRF